MSSRLLLYDVRRRGGFRRCRQIRRSGSRKFWHDDLRFGRYCSSGELRYSSLQLAEALVKLHCVLLR